MSVYVDDMRAPYGRMLMSHMVADTTGELLAMADRIGVSQRWLQCAGTHREHFDVCLSMRKLAIQQGAVEVTLLWIGKFISRRRNAMSAGKETGGKG